MPVAQTFLDGIAEVAARLVSIESWRGLTASVRRRRF
jgi:hypothetical protein